MKDEHLALLKFVERRIAKGRAPSVKEMAECLGKSKATIGGYLYALESAGHITRDHNKSRSIRITGITGGGK